MPHDHTLSPEELRKRLHDAEKRIAELEAFEDCYRDTLCRLQQSETRFRALFNNLKDAVFVHKAMPDGTPGIFEDVNPAACELTGYSWEELLCMSPWELDAPDIGPRVIPGIARALQEKGSTVFESVHMDKQGGRIPVEINASLFTLDDTPYIVSVVRDIRERKQSEEALQRFRVALDHSGDAVFLIDPATMRFVDCNRTACVSLGYSREDILTMGPQDIKPEMDAEMLALHFSAAAQQEQPLLLETVHRRKDGTSFPVEIALKAVSSGDRDLMVASVRDVTERKRAHEAVIVAMEAAEKANRAKSAFLASISHELRTPIHGILGMLQLLEDCPTDQERLDYVATATNVSQHLLAIIEDMLLLSRIEAGLVKPQHEPFWLLDTLRKAVEKHDCTATKKGLDLYLCTCPHLPSIVTGDVGLLGRIIDYLLDNGLKFTHSGEVVLRAECSSQNATSDGFVLDLAVSDSGIGIPKDKQEVLFTPFFQADESFSRQHQGTGLGLGIVQRLTTLLGGRCTLSSEPDLGTTVCISISMRTS
jgi:PAS domain S-box-containing protein